eukprot:539215-Rhodomonas_salina.1
MSTLTHTSFLSPPTHIQTTTNHFAHMHWHTHRLLTNQRVQRPRLPVLHATAYHMSFTFPLLLTSVLFPPTHTKVKTQDIARGGQTCMSTCPHTHTHTHHGFRLGSGREDRPRVGLPEARPRVWITQAVG